MSWIEPASTAVSAATLVNEVAKASPFLRRHAKRIVWQIKNGSVAIPLFGCGGTGKTTASKLIVGQDPLEISAAYDESWQVEPVDLPGDVPGQLLVAPGQASRVERHWPSLLARVADGRSVGVVNVVSYGHHSFGERWGGSSLTKHDLYRDGMTEGEFAEAYGAGMRAREVTMLHSLVAGLTAVRRDIWMVTVVNKQDLWWDRREEVRRHYEEGSYAEQVDAIRRNLGQRSFQHEFIPVSLTLGNMVTPAGEVIARTVAGYDMPLHLTYLNGFFAKLHGLIDQPP